MTMKRPAPGPVTGNWSDTAADDDTDGIGVVLWLAVGVAVVALGVALGDVDTLADGHGDFETVTRGDGLRWSVLDGTPAAAGDPNTRAVNTATRNVTYSVAARRNC